MCGIVLLAVAAVAGVAAAAPNAAAATNTGLQSSFPSPSGSTALAAVRTIAAGEAFDGGMMQWDRSRESFVSLA